MRHRHHHRYRGRHWRDFDEREEGTPAEPDRRGRHHARYRSRRRGGGCGPIGRVVQALAARFGVHRHTVMAGFVAGFVFVPLLTLLLFLAAWYWTSDPEKVENALDDWVARIQRTLNSWLGGSSRADDRAGERGGASPDPGGAHWPPRAETPAAGHGANGDPAPDLGRLEKRLRALDERARALEAYVASREFSLRRQFRAMEDPR